MMKSKKLLRFALSVLLVFALVAGCAPAPGETPAAPTTLAPAEPVAVAAIKGPTGMGMAQMMEQNEGGLTKQPYAFTIAAAPDEVVSRFVTGEVDIAAAPINLAANLYQKTNGDVVVIAVNTLGVLYILENGDTVHSLTDLAGKTLSATAQGSTPEYILNYLLEKNGVAGAVTTEYLMEHADLAALLAAGERTLGMLPEPNATATLLKNKDMRVAIDLNEEWEKVAGDTKLVQGCIMARRSLVEERPEVIALFLADYAASVEAVNSDPAAAGALIERFEILPSAAAAAKALPNCNIVCITGEEMKASAAAMLKMLYEADPKSVGGQLPPDDLYYIMQ